MKFLKSYTCKHYIWGDIWKIYPFPPQWSLTIDSGNFSQYCLMLLMSAAEYLLDFFMASTVIHLPSVSVSRLSRRSLMSLIFVTKSVCRPDERCGGMDQRSPSQKFINHNVINRQGACYLLNCDLSSMLLAYSASNMYIYIYDTDIWGGA